MYTGPFFDVFVSLGTCRAHTAAASRFWADRLRRHWMCRAHNRSACRSSRLQPRQSRRPSCWRLAASPRFCLWLDADCRERIDGVGNAVLSA
jgi:hypothetical protein